VVGTGFAATESGDPSHVASYTTLVVGGATLPNDSNAPSTNMPLSLHDAAGNTTLYIGSGATGTQNPNRAVFNNDLVQPPIGGISSDNLPYVVLIAIALLALIGYIMIRSRRNAYR